MPTANDIVVTGLAAISSAGVGVERLRETLARNDCRLTSVPFELVGESGHLSGKADDFRAVDHIPPLKARKFDRCSLFAVVAVGMALKDAGVDLAVADRTRIGIVLGCGFSGVTNSAEFLRGCLTGEAKAWCQAFLNTVANAPASNASIEYGLRVGRHSCPAFLLGNNQRFSWHGDFWKRSRFARISSLPVASTKSTLLSCALSSRWGSCMVTANPLAKEQDLWSEAGSRASPRGFHPSGLGRDKDIGPPPAEYEQEGVGRLLGDAVPSVVNPPSGTAEKLPSLVSRLPKAQLLHPGALLGRSLAMGGLAMVSLLLFLPAGASGLHLAASPEGPYYAVDFIGGIPA